MADTPLQALESKIDELIALCRELNRENQRLQASDQGGGAGAAAGIDHQAVQGLQRKIDQAMHQLRQLEIN